MASIIVSNLIVLGAVTGVLAIPAAAPISTAAGEVPQFALDYAPVVWIHSEDPYFPGPFSAQLLNTHPTVNFTPIEGAPSPLTLDNLDQLNSKGGRDVALSSNDDFTKFPAWLNGSRPDANGKTAGDPSVAIITADKGNGIVDVFYMFFYPFNRGNEVFGDDAGNHLGDWEHMAVRFSNGSPTQVYMSQHANGEAFTYNAVEKQGKRPVGYSARGSHATYATDGKHDHTIPNVNLPFDFFLTDECNQGTLWDPAKNAYFYSFDRSSNQVTPYSVNADAPTSWLYFQGIWGDKELPESDPRQHYFLGIKLTAKWTGAPTGPLDKDLGRTNVCPDGKECNVKTWKGLRKE